ncbi:MAG: capsule biosynthesis protein [Parvularculaceae bacterium]
MAGTHGDRAASLASHLRKFIRSSPVYAPVRRARLAALTRRPDVYPDWRALMSGVEVSWRQTLLMNHGPRILIATHLGLHFAANTVDSLLAVALTWRSARVDIAFCDGVLPACQMIDHGLAPSVERYAKSGPQPDFCTICHGAGKRVYEPLGLKTHDLSSFLSDEDRDQAAARAALRAEGPLEPVAGDAAEEHAFSGALRFFGRASLADTKVVRRVLARYLTAADLADRAARRLLAQEKYDIVIAHHGIYVPQGPTADAARRAGARLVTWHASYRRGRLIFEHGDTYHRAMIKEPASRWAARPLSARQETALDDYLASRATGALDWITFQRDGPQPIEEIENALGLRFDKPTTVLIGSVAWDALLHYPGSAYCNMIEWAIETAKWFAARPNQQLIIRCHPGEVLSSPRATDRLDESVVNALGRSPRNIVIAPPESALNTYAIAEACGRAIIYNTKMGVELAARGMPVIVAGDAWIRGKGFSFDAADRNEYFALLAQTARLKPLNEHRRALARRYAYHFFFRRCIPVDCINAEKGWPLCALVESAGARARPGMDPGLDAICKAIFSGVPFELDAAAPDDSRWSTPDARYG